jgi:hypothetical protein
MTVAFVFVLFVFGHFVANHATHGGTRSGAQHAAPDNTACHATNDSARGSSFFLCGHAGTTAQTQGKRQPNGGRPSEKVFVQVHDE